VGRCPTHNPQTLKLWECGCPGRADAITLPGCMISSGYLHLKCYNCPMQKYKTLAEFFNDLQKPRKSQVEAVRRIILRAESNLIN
jgi:hypothetical protein